MLNPTEISAAIQRAFAHGHSLAIVSVVAQAGQTTNQTTRLLIEEGGAIVGGTLGFGQAFDASAAEQALALIADERQELVTQNLGETRLLFEIARPPLELIVCGGGHVGLAVAQAGVFLGFRVTVIDDRTEFVARDRFPDERIRLIADDFVVALQSLKITPASHLVIVTRGHKHDEICLQEVIDKPARYIGMIGSRRRTTTIRAHLKREGVSAELLRRVYAPIGLDIGAQTPEEIALAILAEIIMIRRGGDGRAKSSFVREK
ncbi:MAG TPA: XdhC family protein [Blastocatellia bacterium]|nr:XdhC family protein [Blastocatellia bacterium]